MCLEFFLRSGAQLQYDWERDKIITEVKSHLYIYCIENVRVSFPFYVLVQLYIVRVQYIEKEVGKQESNLMGLPG